MTTTLKDRTLPPATADEIRAIFRRTLDLIHNVFQSDDEDDEDDEDDPSRRDVDLRFPAALEALRFCCVAAGQLGSPSMLPLIAEAFEVLAHYDDDADDDKTAMASGVHWLLHAGARVDEDIKALAADPTPQARLAVAEGLSPRGEAEIALLNALSSDPIAEVRNAAKKALSGAAEVPWWRGKLSRDPLARLSSEEALRLKAPLSSLSSILDASLYRVKEREAEVRELAQALPDDLLVDLVETIHAAVDPYRTRLLSLIQLMISRSGGVAAFMRLLPRWTAGDGYLHREAELLATIKAMPLEERARICKELLPHLARFPDEDRWCIDDRVVHFVASVIGDAWPPGEDLTPLLDTILALSKPPEGEYDYVVRALSAAFRSDDADPTPILGRLIEARLAGYPDRYKEIAHSLDVLLTRAPVAAIRAAAERAILSDDEATARWGIEELMQRAFDPARDGSRADLARRFMVDARYRALIAKTRSLSELCLPLLREDLRRGSLSRVEAEAVLGAIGSVYGGIAERNFGAGSGAESQAWAEEHRRKKRQALGEHLGPPELAGPPTDEEWRRLRALRAAWADAGFEPSARDIRSLGAFPEGPWSDEDRAFVDAALGALRRVGPPSEEDFLGHAIASALASKPDPSDLGIIEEVMKLSPPSERDRLKECLRELRAGLGLPENPSKATPGASKAAPPAQSEWMDESDDEGDERGS